MSRLRPTTLILAFALGAIGTAYVWPHWQETRAVRRALGEDAEERSRGWSHLGRTDESRRRAAPLLSARLADAPDEALLDAADHLRPYGLWQWRHQDPDVILRELRLRLARDPEAARELVVAMCWEAPFDLESDPLMMLIADVPAAIEPALAWAGPDPSRIDLLPRRAVTERARLLALASVDPYRVPPLPDPVAPSPTLDAQLLAHILRAPEDGEPIRRAAPHLSVDLFRAWSTDPRERQRLGEAAQIAADPDRRHAALVAIADDPAVPVPRRRRALWDVTTGAPPDALVHELLAAPVADERGDVALTALVAEKHLGVDEAAALALHWIQSFDDDEKRAGAMLASLTGAHRAKVAQALGTEDVAAVRTAFRLALWGEGGYADGFAPREFAYRALRHRDGDLSLDTVVFGLAAGDLAFVRILVSDGGADSLRCAERFLPPWPPMTHRPVAANADDLRFFFAWLRATWAVHARRLRFDTPTRTFVPIPPSSTPDSRAGRSAGLPPAGKAPKMES